MGRVLRRWGIIAGVALAVFAVLMAGRAWKVSQEFHELDRAYLYGRALEWAVAERAGPTTPAAFDHVLPFDIPVAQRPPGADPQAFIGMGNAVLPCPRTAAMMRAEGPGECSALYPASGRDQAPRLCGWMPCTVVVAPPEFASDPAFRAALRAPGLRARMCALREPPSPFGWTHDPARVPDCGPGWLLRGHGYVAVPTGGETYRFLRMF